MFKSITSALLVLSAAALWPAPVQTAGERDLTTAENSCTINGTIYAQGETQEIAGLQRTHDLLVGDRRLINGSHMLLLDTNQPQANSLFALDQVQIYGSGTSGLTNYPFTGSTGLIYDMGADSNSWVKPDSNVTGGPSSGSGNFDMTLKLSAADSALLAGFSHFYLFSQFGIHFANNDGYQEWVAVVPEPSVPWVLALGLLVVALRRASLGFRSNGPGRVGSKDLAGAAT